MREGVEALEAPGEQTKGGEEDPTSARRKASPILPQPSTRPEHPTPPVLSAILHPRFSILHHSLPAPQAPHAPEEARSEQPVHVVVDGHLTRVRGRTRGCRGGFRRGVRSRTERGALRGRAPRARGRRLPVHRSELTTQRQCASRELLRLGSPRARRTRASRRERRAVRAGPLSIPSPELRCCTRDDHSSGSSARRARSCRPPRQGGHRLGPPRRRERCLERRPTTRRGTGGRLCSSQGEGRVRGRSRRAASGPRPRRTTGLRRSRGHALGEGVGGLPGVDEYVPGSAQEKGPEKHDAEDVDPYRAAK